MRVDIRWFLARLNANYWFYPALFALTAVLLAFGLIQLDRMGAAEWLNQVEAIVPARPDGAANMLTVIAGSMIGVASTVFSITIAAVAYASGTYGPRLLTNFMEDKGNQLSLATFIGTFVYALTVLRSVRKEDEPPPGADEALATALPGFVPQLSLLVAYLLMALSIAVLVYFLNHIPSSIRINSVLEGIGKRLLRDIADNYPDDHNGGEAPPAPDGRPLTVQATGYVQLIEFDELEEIAEEAGCRIALEVRTGDFVHSGMPLIRICEGSVDDKLAEKLRGAFTLGSTRTPTQDPRFLIDELVEIGLRALSPGINDPFTAITAIHWLGAAIADLGLRDLDRRREDHPDGNRVEPLPETFGHFLNRSFGTMRSGVATSPTAALIMLDALRTAAEPLPDRARKEMLREQGAMLCEQARHSLNGPDLERVEERYAAFQQAFA
ncbi:DUF2254 domain-containing protein [Pelagerythrobacter marensis]|uniref:DUF2254 domain-containing protein n=1 Tax=Pelagerythrobacter marensis TaxID=543877 RepID=A0ABZ2D4T1_9SPHN